MDRKRAYFVLMGTCLVLILLAWNVVRFWSTTAAVVMSDDWTRPYPRSLAAFPLPYLRTMKVWPTVGRIDNPYGDRNLVCACPPMDEYAEEPVEA